VEMYTCLEFCLIIMLLAMRRCIHVSFSVTADKLNTLICLPFKIAFRRALRLKLTFPFSLFSITFCHQFLIPFDDDLSNEGLILEAVPFLASSMRML
jgi:hypothetical protein